MADILALMMATTETRKAKSRLWPQLVVLVVVIIVLGLLATGYFRHPTGPASGESFTGTVGYPRLSKDLRLGTFNIDGGHGTDGKLDLARTARCMQRLDFVGMEEVHGFLFTHDPNEAVTLSHLLKLKYLWAPSERQWWHYSFGNADFTDLPVITWSRIPLPSHWNRALRNYVLTVVRWNGLPVHIITTHTDWKTGGTEQLRLVINQFMQQPQPAVLMGDLNTPEHDPQIQKLMHTPGVVEAVQKILGPTYPGRVDYIFLRGLRAVDAGEVNIGASDHPAFWAAANLPGK